MRTLVIMLISFMEGLSQDTLGQHILNSDKGFPKIRHFSFGHHETIRIKENLDTQAFSLRFIKSVFVKHAL